VVEILPLVDEGLGNSSYLVNLGDGRALAVDPERDPRPYRELAAKHGLRIAFSADTHLHADFLSGGLELAADGATMIASADGGREFPYHAMRHDDEFDLGGLTLRALATPGHTLEHVSYLLLDGSEPVALFTGGALIVGSVARTDLVDASRADELARLEYHGLHDHILTLPDSLAVYPTHGAGSFCSAPPGAERTTTIGRERATNPLVRATSEDAFVHTLLSSLGTYPTYFHYLPAENRRGPKVLRTFPELPQLDLDSFRAQADAGATIVDARPVEEFGAGHIPGSLSIALTTSFESWLGWVVHTKTPLVFVLDDDTNRRDLVRQALIIGYDNIAGELAGGIDAWRAAGLPIATTAIIHSDEMPAESSAAHTILDVRQESEWEAGHIPGAVHIELGAVPTADNVPDGQIIVMCAHGNRAMTAASLLEQRGKFDVTVLRGGPEVWAEVPGHSLVTAA
jgi:rhodanese-related sulfurtransferase/glyoxylase-like metal-dependent hydrolase (beta-lactamase superfamily II)